jgi:20S proteasome subunit beta 7
LAKRRNDFFKVQRVSQLPFWLRKSHLLILALLLLLVLLVLLRFVVVVVIIVVVVVVVIIGVVVIVIVLVLVVVVVVVVVLVLVLVDQEPILQKMVVTYNATGSLGCVLKTKEIFFYINSYS